MGKPQILDPLTVLLRGNECFFDAERACTLPVASSILTPHPGLFGNVRTVLPAHPVEP